MDWINSYSPLTYDDHKGELSLFLMNILIIFLTEHVTTELKLCEQVIDLNKVLLQVNDIIVAQLFSITVHDLISTQQLFDYMQVILD
jgi:hypothetical protein